MPQNTGPDFICVGMPKAGTGWLYDQLQSHPDFWMPLKEIDYLAFEYPKMKHAIRWFERTEKRKHRKKAKRRHVDAREYNFLKEASACAGEPRDIAHYAELFRYKGEQLSGDISPSYSRMEEALIADIGRGLPQVKIILLVRDPITRAWSHISLLHRLGKFDASILESPPEFRSFLANPRNIERRSFATRVVERWTKNTPHLEFRSFFFDEIVSEPEATRREILRYLGADPARGGETSPPDFNPKANKSKLTLTEPLKGVLIDFFKEELRAGAEIFGSHAENWKDQYGV